MNILFTYISKNTEITRKKVLEFRQITGGKLAILMSQLTYLQLKRLDSLNLGVNNSEERAKINQGNNFGKFWESEVE